MTWSLRNLNYNGDSREIRREREWFSDSPFSSPIIRFRGWLLQFSSKSYSILFFGPTYRFASNSIYYSYFHSFVDKCSLILLKHFFHATQFLLKLIRKMFFNLSIVRLLLLWLTVSILAFPHVSLWYSQASPSPITASG